MDIETQKAIKYFAEQHNILVAFPDFKIHKALEANRILDVQVARDAWDAWEEYQTFKGLDLSLSEESALFRG